MTLRTRKFIFKMNEKMMSEKLKKKQKTNRILTLKIQCQMFNGFQ